MKATTNKPLLEVRKRGAPPSAVVCEYGHHVFLDEIAVAQPRVEALPDDVDQARLDRNLGFHIGIGVLECRQRRGDE